MKSREQRDLFPGALEMMILRTIKRQPLHGYALAQHIKRTSNDLLQIEEGSLYAARREFGNVTLTEEDSREAWRRPSFENLLMDVRYGCRVLRKNPGFTTVAVLTLTLGIGATSAIFSVVDAVLLRPLPYRDPNRLVTLYEDRTRDGFPRKEFTPANYADCKTQTQIFRDISAGVE